MRIMSASSLVAISITFSSVLSQSSGLRLPPTNTVNKCSFAGARPSNTDELNNAPRMSRFSTPGISMPKPSGATPTWSFL